MARTTSLLSMSRRVSVKEIGIWINGLNKNVMLIQQEWATSNQQRAQTEQKAEDKSEFSPSWSWDIPLLLSDMKTSWTWALGLWDLNLQYAGSSGLHPRTETHTIPSSGCRFGDLGWAELLISVVVQQAVETYITSLLNFQKCESFPLINLIYLCLLK